MKAWRKFVVVAVICSAALGFAADPPSKVSPAKPSVTQWEYTYYCPGSEQDNVPMLHIMKKLNEMGDQGWELISVNAHNGSWVRTAVYIFKRRK